MPEEAYCNDESDITRAATMVCQWVGETTQKTATAGEAIAVGERIMRRTRDEHAQLLLRFWKCNENTVLFATQREGRSSVRTGLAVSVPLAEAFYLRFRGGGAEDMDITPADMVRTSSSVLHLVGADTRGLAGRRGRASQSMATARTILYQLASLWPPLHSGDRNPRLLSIAGSPEGGRRLRAFSFKDTGAKTPVTDRPLMEFASPSLSASGMEYPLDLGNYLAMKAIGLLYQAGISGQLRQLAEDSVTVP